MKLAPAAFIAWVTFSGPIQGQETMIGRAMQTFVTCARSVASQQYALMRQKEIAVELAFQGCATEEQALYVATVYTGAAPVQARDMIGALKFRLKQQIVSGLQ